MLLNPAKAARSVPADRRHYVPAIDGLRVLAAFGVILAHVGSEFGPTHHVVAFGGAAVQPALIVFFTISGYLVYRPFARRLLTRPSPATEDRRTTFWVYLPRRILRIFPLYWTVFAVAVIWNGPGNLDSPVDWFQAIFLMPFPDPTTLLAGPLGIAMWTLAIELPFYVLVPLFASGVKQARARWSPRTSPFHAQVLAIGSLIVLIYGLGLAFGAVVAFPASSLPVGMMFGVWEVRKARRRPRYPLIRIVADNWWIGFMGYVLLVFVSAHFALEAYASPEAVRAAAEGRGFDAYAQIRTIYFPLQMAMALLLFVPVAFGLSRSLMVRAMASTPLQIIAPLTYGIYLWHVPLIRHTTGWFGPGLLGFPFPSTTGFGAPTMLIATGLAMVTFVLVERPVAALRAVLERRAAAPSRASTVPAGSKRGDPLDDAECGEAGYAADLLIARFTAARGRGVLTRPADAEFSPSDGSGRGGARLAD